MRKLFALAIIITGALLVTGCSDSDDKGSGFENDPASLEWMFRGPVKVQQADGSTYTHNNVITRLVFNSARTRCDMFVYNVSFAGNMPVQIDMAVYGLTAERSGEGYRITGDDIVPWYGTREFPRYTIYGLEGTATTAGFEYKMTCGDGKEHVIPSDKEGEEDKTDTWTAYPVQYFGEAYDIVDGDINEDNTVAPDDAVSGGTFSGEMTVTQSDQSLFKMDDVEFEIVFDDLTKKTGSLVMYDVSFAQGMVNQGIYIDMEIPGITFVKTDSGYKLEADGIAPVSGGKEVERYMVTGLTGSLTAEALTVSMACGIYPLTYTGTVIQE